MNPTSETIKDDLAFVHSSGGGDAHFTHSLEPAAAQHSLSNPGDLVLGNLGSGTTAASEFHMNALVKTMKGKEKEWSSVAEKKRPLRLLDLPVDILREIIGQVSCVADRN
jgi:hypothetical protein